MTKLKLPANFAELIAPIGEAQFFKEYYAKKPLHIKGSASKAEGLPDWQGLSNLLNQTSIWSKDSLLLVLDRKQLLPREYCHPATDRDHREIMRPDAAKVTQWLHKGASLVANDIDSLTPALAQIAKILEDKLDGKSQANLYASSRSRQAFNSHFDTHDVFAFHVVGEKRWKIYETLMNYPIRHARFGNASYNEATHQAQRGKILLDIVMQPGDLLYIPRGQYHDALASSGDNSGSIHIAFGLTSVIGLDVYTQASDLLINDPLFRQNIPRSEEGHAALKQRLGELADRFQKLAKDDGFIETLTAWQKAYRYPRGGISLPIQSQALSYALVDGFDIVETNGESYLKSPKGNMKIPAHRIATGVWILATGKAKGQFDRYDFMDEFAHLPSNECDQVLQEFINMGVIKIL